MRGNSVQTNGDWYRGVCVGCGAYSEYGSGFVLRKGVRLAAYFIHLAHTPVRKADLYLSFGDWRTGCRAREQWLVGLRGSVTDGELAFQQIELAEMPIESKEVFGSQSGRRTGAVPLIENAFELAPRVFEAEEPFRSFLLQPDQRIPDKALVESVREAVDSPNMTPWIAVPNPARPSGRR